MSLEWMSAKSIVKDLQDTIVERTGSIFDQLSNAATSAISAAAAFQIPDDVSLPHISTDVSISADAVDFSEDEYASTLFTALQSKLISEINNGGFGIDTGDESRLFERARERELELVSGAVEESTRLFASGGFSMPTGAAAAAILRAQREGQNKISSINRDVMSKQADVFITAKGQILTAATQVEGQVRQGWSDKLERSLKKAIAEMQALVEAAVAEGNISVAGLSAAVQAALGEAEIKVKAAIAKGNIYAQLATASMSGLHVNATLGADANAGLSGSAQVSDSESVSYDHNYQEK